MGSAGARKQEGAAPGGGGLPGRAGARQLALGRGRRCAACLASRAAMLGRGALAKPRGRSERCALTRPGTGGAASQSDTRGSAVRSSLTRSPSAELARTRHPARSLHCLYLPQETPFPLREDWGAKTHIHTRTFLDTHTHTH